MSIELSKHPIEQGEHYKIWENKEFEYWNQVTKPESTGLVPFYYPEELKGKVKYLTQVSITPYYNHYKSIITTIGAVTDTYFDIYFSKLDGNTILETQNALVYIKGRLK